MNPSLLIVLTLLYLAPLLRLLLFFLHDNFFLIRRLNIWAGRFELYLGGVRDYVVIVGALFFLGQRIYGWIKRGEPFSWPVEILFLAIALYSRWWRWRGLIPLHEFARCNPRAHPTEFFGHLYARLGFLPHRVPAKAIRVIDPCHLNFRKNKDSKKSFWLILHGMYDSYIFATLAYNSFRWGKSRYIKTAGSGISLIWASRIVQLARMEVVVERSPELEKIKTGKIIFAINHKSFFDFCLAPFAYLKEKKDGSADSFTPSIMAAKDHFKDNFFLYRVVGFGRMLEAWGMIFVDRKTKTAEKTEKMVSLAVKKLLSSDMPFSLYPQGTRAWGQEDRNGSRWDAGYFCVGKSARLKTDGAHFKKGLGFIAVEAAWSLMKHQLAGPVWIIPVGMNGPGTACPKEHMMIQTETRVVIKLGDPIEVDPEEFRPLKAFSHQEVVWQKAYLNRVDKVVQDVDKAMQKMLEVPTRLERRFFVDLRDVLDARGVDEVAVAFKEWRGKSDLVYSILDCIYCLPQKKWRGCLVELAHLLRGHCSKEELGVLRDRIADCF